MTERRPRSNHSWGTAVDVNAEAMNRISIAIRANMVPLYKALAETARRVMQVLPPRCVQCRKRLADPRGVDPTVCRTCAEYRFWVVARVMLLLMAFVLFYAVG